MSFVRDPINSKDDSLKLGKFSILRKWNVKTHQYDNYKVPIDKVLLIYSDDLDKIVNCAQCLKKVRYGDCYTSLEIHNHLGMGYVVCKDCYDEEFLRRRNAYVSMD